MFSDYAKYYELFNQEKTYKEEIEFVYKWADKPKTVFDIGCGAANYWKYYPKKVKLSGCERSKDMISLSKYQDQIANRDVTEAVFPDDVDLVTALFDVINYIPVHNWWWQLPLEKGGYFIFDVWDTEKVRKEKFKKTIRKVSGFERIITPFEYDGKKVNLKVQVFKGGEHLFEEVHTMYLYGRDMIEKFCQDDFEIVEVKETESWQQWFKLRKK